MKVVAIDIETICHFSKNSITPLKFKYQEGDSYKVVKVDRIVSRTEEKYCGNTTLVFDCQSVINGVERLFQLKFFKLECLNRL